MKIRGRLGKGEVDTEETFSPLLGRRKTERSKGNKKRNPPRKSGDPPQDLTTLRA